MAQKNYEACCAFVRKQEGGNTDTPGDRGGRTGRGGITHAVYDAYRTRKGFPLRDVFKITDPEIAEIYATEYWSPVYGDRLPAGQDLALFDYAINSGPAKANEARLSAGDGDVPTLIRKICAGRLTFMHALGSWSRFGRAWTRRVSECEALALHMYGSPGADAIDHANDAKFAKRYRVIQIIMAGVSATGGAIHFGLNHTGIAALVTIAGIAAAIAISNAYRHGVHADMLMSAIVELRRTRDAAAAAVRIAELRASQAAQIAAAKAVVIAAAKEEINAPRPSSLSSL